MQNEEKNNELKNFKQIFFKYINLIYIRKIFNLCLQYILEKNKINIKYEDKKIIYVDNKDSNKEKILNSIIFFLFDYKYYFNNILHVNDYDYYIFKNEKREGDEIFNDLKKNFENKKFIITDNDQKKIFKEIFGYEEKKFTYKEIFQIVLGNSNYFKEINKLLKLDDNNEEFWLNERDFNLNDYLKNFK
jgi:capsular polysaccharide biosynthesis protein